MKKNKILLVCALIFGVPALTSSIINNQNIVENIVKAETKNITINYSDNFSPSLPSNKDSCTNTTSHSNGSINFKINNVYKNSGYLMFVEKKGYLYNENSLGKITNIKVTYSANTSANAQIAVGFAKNIIESKISSGFKTIAGKSKTDTFTNTTDWYGFFQISSSNKNMQVTKIEIEYEETQEGNKIIFDSNGGTFVPTQYITNGNLILKPDDPTKNGYKFLGWYYNDQLWDFETIVNGEMTLVAKWGDLDLTKIKNVNTENVYYRISGEVVAQSNFQTIFVQDETGALQVYQPSQYFKGKVQVGDDVTLVGKYGLNNGNPQLIDIIDFKVNNSDDKIDTLPLTNTSEVTKENANKYFKLEKLKIKSEEKKTNSYTYTLNDYDFVLYYSNNTFVDGYDKLIVGSYVDVEGALVIYNNNNKETIEILVTKVVESQRFTVTFKSNGGSNVESQKVFPGEKITKPTNPTKQADGYITYEFAGWFTDSGLTQEYDFNSEVNEDITLYAKWNSKTLSSSEIFTTMQTKSKLSAKYTKNLEKSLKENVDHNLLINSKLGENYTLNNATISSNKFVEMKKDDSFIQYTLNNEVNGSINIDYNIVKTGTGSTTLSVSSYDIANNEIETLTALEFTGDMKADSGSITLSKDVNLIKYIKFSINKAPGSNLRVNSLNIKYDEVSTTTNYTITDASIRYGATIPSAAYDTNANYGLLVTSGTKLDALIASNESIESLYSIADANNDNKVSKEEFISALDINLEIETTDYNSLTPVKTDANGKANENGEYYQFGINFTSALNHIDTKLCAIAYMEINGEIFITKETNYSLRTLAQKYIDEKILADNEDATSVLNAIVSYKK